MHHFQTLFPAAVSVHPNPTCSEFHRDDGKGTSHTESSPGRPKNRLSSAPLALQPGPFFKPLRVQLLRPPPCLLDVSFGGATGISSRGGGLGDFPLSRSRRAEGFPSLRLRSFSP